MDTIRSLNRKYLLIPKVFFFSIAMLFYTLHTFKSVFAKDKFKVSESAVGTGFGTLMFITFFTNIYIGSLNDKWGMSKWFLILFLTLSSIFFQLFFFLNLTGGFSSVLFWINMLFYLGANLCTTPLMDKIVLEYLSKIPNIGANTYGTQRLWGTVGYAVCNYVVEYIVTDSKNEATQWTNLRVYNILVALITVGLCYYLINWDTTRRETARNDMWKSFKELLFNWDYMFFIFIILLNGLTRASMTIFLTVYWKDVVKMKPYDLKNYPGVVSGPLSIFNKNTTSTANMFGIIFEIVTFFTAKGIIERIGYFWPLFLAQGAQMVRFVLYWMLPYDSDYSYAAVCGIELFKGINFGLTHCSAVQLAQKLCPPHLKATSQMVYQGTFTGLGSVLAGLICSVVFSGDTMKDKNIPRSERARVFNVFFIVNMVFTALTLLLFFYMYGIVENVLFNSENAEKKLEMYDEKNMEETKKKQIVDKNVVENK
ncbi:hexose transporter [Vairimorpha necatrix]|uniref:Hexose transporter n=1 Tax=Vairimorpha necatrix TaxID=6039 RepID=A0AAX4JE58_9MICR